MKFYVKDIPEPYPVWHWICDHSDVKELSASIKPSVDTTRLLNLKHTFDINHLSKTVLGMLETYGGRGWQSAKGEDKSYTGLSLVMNPNYKENCDTNYQTLGTQRNQPTDFFWSQTHNFESVKNTYYDSYAFRQLSPCVAHTDFGNFVKGFDRSPIRGRISTINSQFVPPEHRRRYGWHKDELVFENLRINIPIQTDETFLFELLNHKPVHLNYGDIYSWDTNIAHRVFPTTAENRSRIHVVLGFSPWFDYNAEEDSWTANEFYGKMHPIDMLINGYVHKDITCAK